MSTTIGLGVRVSGASGSAAQLGRVGDAADRSGDRWRKMGDLAKAGGLAVAAGAAVAAKGLYDAGQAAGDLGETLSKTNAIFGDQGGAALAKWAKDSEVSLGQSQQTALDAAATFGTFGKAAGLAGSDLVKFAQNNAALATDMASFSNTSPEEAIEAIGAAFRGEAEPMRSYGVLLDDATLRTTALRLGLVKTTKEALTPQQKVLAAQAAILKQTKDAQGDFAKTSGGLAGQQKILAAQLENVKVEIGSGVLPIMTEVTSYISGSAIPTAQKLWKAYERNGIDGLVGKVERLTDTQGKLSPVIDETVLAGQSLWRIVKDLAPAFVDAAGAVPPFLQPLELAGDVLEGIADVLEMIPDGMKSLAIQAGLAALVLPRLAGGVTAATGAFTRGTVAAAGYYQALRFGAAHSQQAAMAATRLGSAAGTAAGIGGLLLLSKGMRDADSASSSLTTGLGGAALGFSLGGPLGAAIGAGVGSLLPIYTQKSNDAKKATLDAAKAASDSVKDYDDLRGTLDKLTGATTSSTRAMVQEKLERSGVLDKFAAEGVQRRTVVDAVLGEGRARREVSRFIAEQENAYANLGTQIDTLGDRQERGSAIGRAKYVEELHNLQDQQKAIRDVINAYHDQGIALRVGIKTQREQGRVVQDFSTLAGKVPKNIVSKLDVKGIYPTVTGLARVANRFKTLDNKQIKAIISATGVDTTVREVRSVAERLREVDKQKVELRGFKQSFARHIGDFREDAGRGGKEIGKRLGDGPKNVRPDLGGYQRSLRQQINEGATLAAAGSRGIGTNLKTGLLSGFAGADGLLSNSVRGAVRSAIAAGNREADIHSPSRKTERTGKMMAKGAEDGMRRGSAGLTRAGVQMIRDVVKGIGKEAVGAERVLNALTNNVERTTGKVKRLQDLRASYVADFQGFSSSVFGAQAPTLEDGSTGPQTVDGLLSFAAGQAEQAKQVRAAVKRLTGPGGLGLSPDLIKQLRSQGAGGIEQILALANGSQQQIALLNSLNKQTNGAYAATGLGLFATQGDKKGLYADQLAAAQRDERLAKMVAREVRDALKGIKLEAGEIRLQGSTIIASINAENRNKGNR